MKSIASFVLDDGVTLRAEGERNNLISGVGLSVGPIVSGTPSACDTDYLRDESSFAPDKTYSAFTLAILAS